MTDSDRLDPEFVSKVARHYRIPTGEARVLIRNMEEAEQ